MEGSKLLFPRFFLALLLYIPFIVLLHFILGIAPGDIWDDLMKWSRRA